MIHLHSRTCEVPAAASPPTALPLQYSPALHWVTTGFGMGPGGASALSATGTPQAPDCNLNHVVNITSAIPPRSPQQTQHQVPCILHQSLGPLGSSLLPAVHLWPIYPVVSWGSLVTEVTGMSRLEVRFPLRCLQRFARPNVATQLCCYHNNWITSGPSTPVLSY